MDTQIRVDTVAAESIARPLRGFFSAVPEKIGHGQELAIALAQRAKLVREVITEEHIRHAKENRKGRLHALLQTFREQVFHELTKGDFADAFAQMLTYGLFLARLNAGDKETITLGNVRQHIPGGFSLSES